MKKNYKILAQETAANCNLTIVKSESEYVYKIYLEQNDYVWFANWRDAYCWLCGFETAMNKFKIRLWTNKNSEITK
jgi:hypothetical protein